MVTQTETMSLERFNALWARRASIAKRGVYHEFVRALPLLEPVRAPDYGCKTPAVQLVRQAFQSAVKKGEAEGVVRGIMLDNGEQWVCRFPAEQS